MRLIVLAGISFGIALAVFIGFITLTNGVVFGIQIKLSLINILKTLVVTIITTYIVAIPSMKYIDSLQLVEILREE